MLDRRGFIAAGVGLAAGARVLAQQAPTTDPAARPKLRQSVCRWCLAGLELDAVCSLAKRCSIESVELLDPEDIVRVRDRGLACAIANGPSSISKGLNRLEHHEAIVKRAEILFPQIAKAGCERVILFAGDRAGLDDRTGLWNCVVGVRRLLPIAEASNLVMAMELLNSKVDHKDHMGDRFAWGLELSQTVSSTRFGLLYDIYHMQIMDGDVTRSLTENRPWIRHIHTAGVPGRGPLGVAQELNYGAIIRALHDAGYRGYIGHEFVTQGDAESALKAAVAECLG